MNIPMDVKIEKAAAKKSGRFAFDDIMFERCPDGSANLIATNGHILAVVPVIPHDDDIDGLIPVEAIKEARKHSNGTLIANITAEANGIKYPRNERKFPNYKNVIPLVYTYEPVFKIAFDPSLLADLAQALGAKRSVVLTFQTHKRHYSAETKSNVWVPDHDVASKPILVHPDGDGTRTGVIMPITISP